MKSRSIYNGSFSYNEKIESRVASETEFWVLRHLNLWGKWKISWLISFKISWFSLSLSDALSNIKVIQTVWNVTLKTRSQYRNEWHENGFMLYLTEQNTRERYNIYRIRKNKKKKTEFVILKTFCNRHVLHCNGTTQQTSEMGAGNKNKQLVTK